MPFDWATVASVAGVLFAGLTILNRRIDRKFEAVDRKFESSDRRFESLEHKFDRRFELVEQQIRALAQDIANLRQDVGRLQGVVERTCQPDRFTRAPAQVRERRPAYGVESSGGGTRGEDEPKS